MGEIMEAVPQLDDPDALTLSESNPALRAAPEQFRPENWCGTGAGKDLLSAAREKVLPLSWVPRNSIISELAIAADARSRPPSSPRAQATSRLIAARPSRCATTTRSPTTSP